MKRIFQLRKVTNEQNTSMAKQYNKYAGDKGQQWLNDDLHIKEKSTVAYKNRQSSYCDQTTKSQLSEAKYKYTMETEIKFKTLEADKRKIYLVFQTHLG